MLALFDLDGTVLDTSAAHAYAAEAALRGRGLPCDPAFVRRFLIAQDGAAAGLPEALYLSVWQDMQPLYGEALPSVRPFPGAPETLHALAKASHRLGVVTSKQRWAVELELRQTRLADAFEVVVCRDDTSQHKPNPQPLLLAQARLGLSGGAYLGDQDTDVLAARAAGMLPIGAGWGWSGGDALRAAGALLVLEEFPALRAVLERLSDAPSGLEAAE